MSTVNISHIMRFVATHKRETTAVLYLAAYVVQGSENEVLAITEPQLNPSPSTRRRQAAMEGTAK